MYQGTNVVIINIVYSLNLFIALNGIDSLPFLAAALNLPTPASKANAMHLCITLFLVFCQSPAS
jgi:hypothetical protein